MLDFKIENSGDVGVVTMNGEVLINNATELKELLMKALDCVDHVNINIEELTELDLSGLQLLCSAYRSSLKLNKNLTLNSKSSAVFKKIIEDAGYICHTESDSDYYKTCLWLKGGK